MGKSKEIENQEPPKTEAQRRVDWFCDAPVEKTQQLSDFHGDMTADQRS